MVVPVAGQARVARRSGVAGVADEPTDEALMTAYVAGDPAAFRTLFERYAPLVLGVLRRGGLREDDARDVLQQAFLHVHRARADWDPARAVRPWIMTIALNCRRELARRHVRRPEQELAHEPAVADRTGRPLETGEEVERLRSALGLLPTAQREVIELHWFAGLPFAQVATSVGASVSAVKVRAHRGYERLRELLGGGGSSGLAVKGVAHGPR